MADELKEMMEALEGIEKNTNEEPKEEPKEEEPKEPTEEEEPPAEEEPPKEEPPAEEEVDLVADNVRLREMLNDLAKRVGAEQSTPPVPAKPGEEKPIEKKDVAALVMEYITDEESDLLIDKPKEILTKVLARAVAAMREDVYRSLPELVGNIAQQHITVWKRVDKFYTDNKDLDQYRDFVRMVGVQIESENPDWTLDKVYDETAKVARARLGLKEQALQKSSADEPAEAPLKPAMPSGRSSRKPSGGPKLTKDQEAMIDILALENR